jgi:hypothetical protein
MAVGSKHLTSQTFRAAVNLSASTQQFCIMTQVAGTDTVTICGVADVPLGILQNSPLAGQPAIVALSGFSKLRVGAVDLAVGARVGSNAAGQAVALVAGVGPTLFTIGRVWDIDNADNDGALVSCTVDCTNPTRNA